MIENWFDDISREEAMSCRLRINHRFRYYHSTTSVHLENIEKYGLCKRSVSGTKTVYYGQLKPELAEDKIEDAIFVSLFPDVSWAGLVCKKWGGVQVYVYVTGRSIIEAGCEAYPDYAILQPLDSRGRIIPSYVKDIMLIGCDCIKISGSEHFYKK